jgi:hypothetical protein
LWDQELPTALSSTLRLEPHELLPGPIPAFTVLTIQPDGWPHVAYLGPAELLELGVRTVGLALWTGSNTAAAATEHGKVVVQGVLEGVGFLVRLEAVHEAEVSVHGRTLSIFRCTVQGAREDQVGYARLTTGTSFEVADAEQTLPRWRATRAALLGALTGPSQER